MISRHEDPVAFERLVTPLLLRDEPRYNLELALTRKIAEGETFGDEPALLLTYGSAPHGMALMTPPYNVLVSAWPYAGAEALADWVADHGIAVPGVMGAPETALAFATRYAERTGARPRVARGSGIYRLTTLLPPRPAPGALRPGTLADLALVRAWLEAFEAETGAVRARPEHDEQRLRTGLYWFWEDGGMAVSLVGCAGFTPAGARIGPVYTPPEHRGRGYASAATAGVTERLLARGLAHTFLYTDLANPTSNKIYQVIGYEHVADVQEVALDG